MEILTQLFTQFAAVLPRLIGALLVLLIGIFIAATVTKIINKVLVASGIDNIADKINDIEFVQKFNIRLALSKIVAKVLYYILVLIFLIAATDILGMPAISQLVSDIINYIPMVIVAAIVLIIGTMFADLLKNIVHTACKSLGIPSANIIANVVFYFVFINAIIVALSQAKIDTGFIKNNLTVLLGAVAGAFALGYGLAAKDLMASILASFYHRNRFDVGDVITIQGITGEIVEMDNASFVIQTEGRKIVFPASRLQREAIEIHDQKMIK
jgi:Conserved TM helix/Mechanosensitive ion channel